METKVIPERMSRRVVDLAVVHTEDQEVLLIAEVTLKADEGKKLQALGHAHRLQAPYAMVVDPSEIRLYEVNGQEGFSQSTIVLNTEEVIRAYDPEIDKNWLNERYLSSLIMSWLYDLIERWEHTTPPGDKQLAAAGLDRDRWRRCVVYSEVRVGDREGG